MTELKKADGVTGDLKSSELIVCVDAMNSIRQRKLSPWK